MPFCSDNNCAHLHCGFNKDRYRDVLCMTDKTMSGDAEQGSQVNWYSRKCASDALYYNSRLTHQLISMGFYSKIKQQKTDPSI